MKKEVCPICEEGLLKSCTSFEEVQYKGQLGQVPLLYSECDTCGCEQGSPQQTLANRRAMISYRASLNKKASI